MLAYFPVPYKDELLYSVIARFKVHQGITSDRQLVSELFGSRDVAAVVDLPGHLKAFEQNTYHITKITAEQWLLDHTLFPAYQYFLPKQRREKLVESLYEGRAWDVHTRIGHAAFCLKDPTYLKVCKSCYLQQMDQHGETYWQRLFQLNGTILCPIHHEYLYETSVPFRPKSKYEYSSANEAKLTKHLAKLYNNYQRDLLIRLSYNLSELLEVRERHVNSFDQWTAYYRHVGEAAGNLSSPFRIDHRAVYECIEQHWTKTILKQLNLLVTGKMDWLVNIFRKHRKSFHYLHHLVVWLTFEKGTPDEVIRNAESMDVAQKTPPPIAQTADEADTTNQRQEWLSIVNSYPSKGIAWLRQYGSAASIYAWLYRHDRQWLKIHTPRKVFNKRQKSLVDWNERDINYLQQFCSLHQQGRLINSKGRSSKTWLIKQIKQHATLEKKQNKFPRTMSYIATLVETIENYQFRRITQLINSLHEKQERSDNWILYRKAGIRKKYQTDSMEKFINKLRMELLHGNSRFISKNSG